MSVRKLAGAVTVAALLTVAAPAQAAIINTLVDEVNVNTPIEGYLVGTIGFLSISLPMTATASLSATFR
jgi:hypothetical protein